MSADTSKNLCQQCGARPAFQNFKYCGKTCGSLARSTRPQNPYRSEASVAPVYVDSRRPYGTYRDNSAVGRFDDDDNDEDDAPQGRMCINCGVEPAYGNFDYCSKVCKAESEMGQGPQRGTPQRSAGSPSTPRSRAGRRDDYDLDVDDGTGNSSSAVALSRRNDMCLNCLNYPKARGFDFCSRLCLTEAMVKLQSPRDGTPIKAPSLAPRKPAGPPCKIPGCKGTEWAPGAKYCGMPCRKAAVVQGLEHACLLCGVYPKMPKRHFCGKKCSDDVEKRAPLLLDVPKTDPKFIDIVKQFNATWQSGTPLTVHRICKVVNAKSTEDAFQAYRKQVEAAGNFVAQKKSAGNELRRWHGTLRECTLGDATTSLTPCASTTCSLCCIVRTSFDMKYNQRGVYGMGIYTSAFSSTSNGYTRARGPGSPYRAMFLTRIIGGKEHLYGTNGVAPGGAPPPGHDSVAVDAKHSALIVFKNEAILPSWLVLYS